MQAKFHHTLIKSLSSSFLVLPMIASAEILEDFSTNLPVITSASRLSESVLSSPSAVTVIDSEMIEATGFTEIADLMRLVPGFIVGHVDGGTQSVISHGEGWEYPNRMQLLIDGRSTYTHALSAIDWNTLGVHMEDIERIEVVRGPAASAYGSNSYSGAINIITKAPELDDRMSLRARYGNEGEQEWLFRTSGQLEDFSYRVSASTRDNDGFDKYRNQQEVLDAREMENFSSSARYRLDTKNEFSGFFSLSHGDVERATLANGFYDSKRKVDAWSLNLHWDHYLTEKQQVKVNVFHNFLDENDMASSYPLSQLIGPNPFPEQQLRAGERTYHSHRTDLEVQYSRVHDNGLQYVLGAGTRYDTMKSEALFPFSGTETNTGFRLFGNLQIPVHSYLTANLGALYEINHTDRPHLSPRGSLNFHIDERQSIRLGYSKAYRIPSLLEENIDTRLYLNDGTVLDQVYLNSGDVTAEKVTSIDISYLGELETYPISWEFRGYHENYKDTIFFYEDWGYTGDLIANELTRIDNAGSSNYYGFEGEVTYRPEKSSFIRFHFNVGHMTGYLLTDVNRSAPYSPTQIITLDQRAPQSSFGLLAAKTWGSWQTNLGLYHVEDMKWSSHGSSVDSYNRVDVSVIKHIPLSSKQEIVIKVAGQNVTKNEIYEFNNSSSKGIEFTPRYYASISLIYF